MAPAMCLVSCTDSQESAQGQVEDFLEDVAQVIHRSEGDSVEEFIDDLHDCVCGKAPGLVDDLSELKDADRKSVLRGVIKSDALRTFIKRVAQGAIARGIDDKELVKAIVKAGKNNDEAELMAALDEVMPHESRIQWVEIVAAFVKIGVAMGLDDKDVVTAAWPAVMEVAEEYGLNVADINKLNPLY